MPFVANRLAEIHEHLDEMKQLDPIVRYVQTHKNPADLVTRFLTADEFKDKFPFWIQGPGFLIRGEEGWPTALPTTEKKNDPELKKALIPVNVIVINNDVLGSSSCAVCQNRRSTRC